MDEKPASLSAPSAREEGSNRQTMTTSKPCLSQPSATPSCWTTWCRLSMLPCALFPRVRNTRSRVVLVTLYLWGLMMVIAQGAPQLARGFHKSGPRSHRDRYSVPEYTRSTSSKAHRFHRVGTAARHTSCGARPDWHVLLAQEPPARVWDRESRGGPHATHFGCPLPSLKNYNGNI